MSRNVHRPFIIAGPCSAESLSQLRSTAQALKEIGVDFFRAGVWKPRTRPNDFEGYGKEALGWLSQIQTECQLPFATEVATPAHVEAALRAGLKGVWIGARTTVNPFAVQEIALALSGTQIKVFVKNPVNPDAALWMGALERFQKAGIVDPVAVHRGFSVYQSGGYRNSPLWMIPLELRRTMPHISILCDPSHIAGKSELVPSLAQKAMDLCFDGLMIEVHPTPQEALSDKQQQLSPSQFNRLMRNLTIHSIDPPNGNLRNQLEELRTQIDLCDNHIVEALAQRMRIVNSIGSLKMEGGMAIFQQKRWNELIDRILQQGDTLGISPLFLEQLFALIHQEAVECQQGMMQRGSREAIGNITSITETKSRKANSREANFKILDAESKPLLQQHDFCYPKPQLCPIDHLLDHLTDIRSILLVDKKVDEFYAHRLPALPKIVIQASEHHKSLETVKEIIQKLMTLDADRETWLVGIGGGVVCDIAGFVASIYKRGIRFILAPTTLLSQADAAIGGKNGVNINGIKNMAGCITQPQYILFDPALLSTLPQKEIRSGLGEVIKHALIGNPALLDYIEQHIQSILALQPKTIHYLLAASHRLKCGIVERDEQEQGIRRILNFGHTIGHAIEAVQQQVKIQKTNNINILINNSEIIANQKKTETSDLQNKTETSDLQNNTETSDLQSNKNFAHGEAVALGMLYAVALSEHYAHLDRSLLPRLKRLYAQCALPTSLSCSLDALCNAMLLDKKRTDTSIRFILLKEPGAPLPFQISIKEITKSLEIAHKVIAI